MAMSPETRTSFPAGGSNARSPASCRRPDPRHRAPRPADCRRRAARRTHPVARNDDSRAAPDRIGPGDATIDDALHFATDPRFAFLVDVDVHLAVASEFAPLAGNVTAADA